MNDLRLGEDSLRKGQNWATLVAVLFTGSGYPITKANYWYQNFEKHFFYQKNILKIS